jgi:hypothetical protein
MGCKRALLTAACWPEMRQGRTVPEAVLRQGGHLSSTVCVELSRRHRHLWHRFQSPSRRFRSRIGKMYGPEG